MNYTLIADGRKEIRLGGIFGTKYVVTYDLYANRIRGNGFFAFADALDFQPFDIDMDDLLQATVETVKGFSSVVLEYRGSASTRFGVREKNRIVLPGIDDPEKCARLITQTMQKNAEKKTYARQLQQQMKEEEQKKAVEAKRFYDDCYAFHIRPDTPVFTLSDEENRAILLYIDPQKAVNFLRIDGYTREESVGVIPYNKIHYYERAGNVSYTTDVHGSFSSFGGSMTGAQFSKKAARIGTALFGLMGMAAGALLTYKPAEIQQPTTDFKLDSEIVKIDDRNVILNFFSDSRGQYIDLELPMDSYNFLQTFLPDKRYSIVEELERKDALNRTAEQKQLKGSETPSELPASDDAERELSAFKIKVEKLKLMKEAGILSEEEFEAERKKLLLSL